MRVLRSGEGLVPSRVSLVMLLTTLTTTLLDVVGAEPCVPCIAAHREAFTKSFGLDFGLDISFGYSIVSQGPAFALGLEGGGTVTVAQRSGECHLHHDGAITNNDGGLGGGGEGTGSTTTTTTTTGAGAGAGGGTGGQVDGHGEIGLAFTIGYGLQWSTGGRMCSWPKEGGPIIVKTVDETPPDNIFTGWSRSSPGANFELGGSIEIHGYIYYDCASILCAYPEGSSSIPGECHPTTVLSIPPAKGLLTPPHNAPLLPLGPGSGGKEGQPPPKVQVDVPPTDVPQHSVPAKPADQPPPRKETPEPSPPAFIPPTTFSPPSTTTLEPVTPPVEKGSDGPPVVPPTTFSPPDKTDVPPPGPTVPDHTGDDHPLSPFVPPTTFSPPEKTDPPPNPSGPPDIEPPPGHEPVVPPTTFNPPEKNNPPPNPSGPPERVSPPHHQPVLPPTIFSPPEKTVPDPPLDGPPISEHTYGTPNTSLPRSPTNATFLPISPRGGGATLKTHLTLMICGMLAVLMM